MIARDGINNRHLLHHMMVSAGRVKMQVDNVIE